LLCCCCCCYCYCSCCCYCCYNVPVSVQLMLLLCNWCCCGFYCCYCCCCYCFGRLFSESDKNPVTNYEDFITTTETIHVMFCFENEWMKELLPNFWNWLKVEKWWLVSKTCMSQKNLIKLIWNKTVEVDLLKKTQVISCLQ